MKRTLINQIVRAALLVPMCLIAFSFVSCSDDDDDSNSVSTADDGYTVSGKINGHYYVDLGLSVKWADRNIGALSSSAYGDYFAWGETETKDSYTSSNSVTYGVEFDDIAGDAEYDAATANWGSKWRMPTKDEFKELKEECSWVWTSRNGFKGYIVTGPSANSIFLPAAGYRYRASRSEKGYRGYYWSCTSYDDIPQIACYLEFDSIHRYMDGFDRYYGYTVRPVSE